MTSDLFEFDFHFFLKILLKYWLLLLIFIFLGCFVGFAASKWLITPIYEARTSLFVGMTQEDGRNDISDIQRAVILGGQLVNDYKELITSRRVKDQVSDNISKGNLLKTPMEFETSVKLKRNTRIVEVCVQSPYPETAQVVADVTAQVFEKLSKDIMRLQNVQIIDKAELPVIYIYPKTKRNIMLGGLIGALLSFAFCCLLELLDRTVKNPEEAAEKLQLPVLGTIIELDDNSRKAATNIEKGTGDRVGIISLDKKRSQEAESFRVLRTNLHYSIPESEKASIFMITSSMPGEGKTMIVSNLATVTADSGKKVLMIDCDLRKPALHKAFKLGRNNGLVNYLAGETSYDDAIIKNILDLDLDIITSGPIPPNPTELLMSEKFKNLLERASHEYDYIFFDSPPCLNMADAAILGRLADRILFTISAGKTRVDFVKRSIEQLKQIDIDVSGIVLNRFSLKNSGYKYSQYGSGKYYYAYAYAYNYGSDTQPEIEVKTEPGLRKIQEKPE
mgnify:CR=1 FL=1